MAQWVPLPPAPRLHHPAQGCARPWGVVWVPGNPRSCTLASPGFCPSPAHTYYTPDRCACGFNPGLCQWGTATGSAGRIKAACGCVIRVLGCVLHDAGEQGVMGHRSRSRTAAQAIAAVVCWGRRPCCPGQGSAGSRRENGAGSPLLGCSKGPPATAPSWAQMRGAAITTHPPLAGAGFDQQGVRGWPALQHRQ